MRVATSCVRFGLSRGARRFLSCGLRDGVASMAWNSTVAPPRGARRSRTELRRPRDGVHDQTGAARAVDAIARTSTPSTRCKHTDAASYSCELVLRLRGQGFDVALEDEEVPRFHEDANLFQSVLVLVSRHFLLVEPVRADADRADGSREYYNVVVPLVRECDGGFSSGLGRASM